MDLFPLRDVIDRYTGQTTVQIFGSMPTSVFTGKSHTCDLINLSHSNSALAVLLPGVKSAAIVSPSMAKSSVNAAFKLLPEHDVAYDGNPLAQQHGPRYFMPISLRAMFAPGRPLITPTVLYFLDEPVAWKLHAAGRLDIDTTGLVLMTDDGQWSHRITSPRHHCEKTYLVTWNHL
ncbi:16S rRNA pseudouridylate synthase A [Escherichia coli]|uniref:16S rRNA pseudouridylate synthase A n=1 Tax=Escherichia coli TaxID=562 RepID=A0A377B7W2_ECOLX|nr:16S rRNA pseudouridylate synthase A [Escherichia coli]